MSLNLKRLTLVLFFVYTLITIVAAVRVLVGSPNPAWVTPVATLACFIFASLHAEQTLGWREALTLLGLCFGISLLFESLGVATGLVYGPYHYSASLGPKFLGLVPFLIPLAWFMMMYPSFLIARALVTAPLGRISRSISIAAIGGLVMTAWDLVMDPVMVAAGHWIWEKPGAYFGVPLQNYWGWWLTTFAIFLIFTLVWPSKAFMTSQQPFAWERWAYVTYVVTGLSSVVVAAAIQLSGPALAGLFGMAPWLLIAWQKNQNTPQTDQQREAVNP
jgi:putative membrane protein